jgi:hypothetical protein
MSLYGFDMLDGASLCRYMSDDEDAPHRASGGGSGELIVLPSDEDEQPRTESIMPESFLYLASALGSTVPTDIEVLEADEESMLSTESGVLILPSVSSSECLIPSINTSIHTPASLGCEISGTIMAMSPHPQLSLEHPLSISTTDSVYTEASLSSIRSSVSLNPSLFPSSIASELMSIHDSTPTLLLPYYKPPPTVARLSPTRMAPIPDDPKEWYDGMKNEFDWESMRYEMYTVLQALDEPVSDELLARLIQEEEELLWKKESQLVVSKKSKYLHLMGDTAFMVVATAVPLFGLSLLMRRTQPFFTRP